MMLNEDYRDMLQALHDEKVRFLLVGAYAMATHGYLRATMDIDIWVLPEPGNAEAVLQALRRFGAPLQNITREDLQTGGTVFQLGAVQRRDRYCHHRIWADFEEAFRRSMAVDTDAMEVHVASLSATSATSVRRDARKTWLTRKSWKRSGTSNKIMQAKKRLRISWPDREYWPN